MEELNSLYPCRSITECGEVRRLVIDSYPTNSTGGDSVAARVFEYFHGLLGGELWAAPNFCFADLYPSGHGVFLDDGRRIAELIFSAPKPESTLARALGLNGGQSIMGGNGARIDGARFGSECTMVHLVARQH